MKTLALQSMHGWGIAQRIRQVSEHVLQVNHGTLYPARHRLEQPGGFNRSGANLKTIGAPSFMC
jgi:DNA-binding PadR family transcriptional regulator